MGFDEVQFNGGKYNLSHLLPKLNEMYDNQPGGEGDFYVYAHCNPLKPLSVKDNIKHLFLASKFPNLTHEPFYVGKGTGDRFANLTRNDSHRKIRSQLLKLKLDVQPRILVDSLSEERAFSIESNLIDILGILSLSKHGILCNLDEGARAQERRLGYSDEMIKKILKKNGFRL